LTTLPFPSSKDGLFDQLLEAAGWAEAHIWARTRSRPDKVKLFARVRGRIAATFDVPTNCLILSDDDVRWRRYLRGSPDEVDPLHGFYVEHMLAKRGVLAVADEPYPLPTHPPNVDAILFSRAEVKAAPKPVLPTKPDPLSARSPDIWTPFREKAELARLKG